MSKDAQPLPVWKQVPLAAVSGCIAWLPTHPFELVKNRVISAPERLSVSAAYAAITANGPAALYTGINAGMSRQVVYTAFRIGLYEPTRELVVSTRATAFGTDTGPTVVDRVVAGAAAGVIASFLSSPVEVALVVTTSGKYPGTTLGGAFSKVYAERGVPGFWSGCIPLMGRAGIVGVSQVAFNDQCKQFLRDFGGGDKWSSTKLTLVSSSITGVFYSTVTMPVEVARVKLSGGQKGTMLGTIGRAFKTTGFSGVYSAYLPYTLRCCVHTVATFVIMDTFKKFA